MSGLIGRERSGNPMEKIALVTGANQGLGLALVEGLSEKLGGDGLVYLTARDATKGEAALRELRRGAAGLLFERLDVTDEGNVSSLARTLRDCHGGLDVVISNAAARITRNVPPARQVRAFIETNNHGAYRMLKHFLPALREGGRFIVIASSFGTLKNLPPQLHQYFDVDSASLEDIDAAMDHYVTAVESGTAEAENWPEWINVPSKIGQLPWRRSPPASWMRRGRRPASR